MAGHQRPLGLQWGAASCSPSDDSEVVVGSLGDGLGSVNLRTGELVASWRGAAAAPADAAVVSVAALGGGAVACGRRDGSPRRSTSAPGSAPGSAGSPSSSSARAAGAPRAAASSPRRRLPWDESGAWESVDDRPPHGSERGAGLCALASGAVLVFAGRYHVRAAAREPAASGKRKRAAFAHAECQENPIDVLAACGATDVATGHRDGSIRVWRGVAAAAGAGGALSAYGVYHWHASAVGALDCGDRGDVLLSGGSEAVLVVWQLRRDETEDRSRDFLPRLGGDVIALRACRSPAVLGGADLCLVVTRTARRTSSPSAGRSGGSDAEEHESSDGVARTLDVVPHNRTSSAAAAAVRRPRVVLAAASRRPPRGDRRRVAARATGGQELKFWEADGRGGFAAAAVVRGPTARASPSAPLASTALVCCATAAPDGLRVWVELDGAAGRWTCALTVAHCAGHGPPRQLCWSPDGSAVAAKAKAAAVSGDRVVVAVPLEPPAAVLVFAADDAAALRAGDGPSPSAALAFDALLRVDPARGADLDAPDTAAGVCELLLAGASY
ncbi:hypothetical protein JL722_14674 [Aureococcus anophagefferens]|nr:hypothetical protein JL722_14674 [Aureococcus anophagefferens]